MIADDTLSDHGSEHEHRRGRAVVGPAAGVLADAPAELAEAHGHDAAVVLLPLEIGIERGDRFGELPEQVGVPAVDAALACVRVEPAERDIEHTRLEPRPDHRADHLQLAAQVRVREPHQRLHAHGLADQLARDLRIECRAHQEGRVGVVVVIVGWRAARGQRAVGLDERRVDVLAGPAEEVRGLERNGLDLSALHRERRGASDGDAGHGTGS